MLFFLSFSKITNTCGGAAMSKVLMLHQGAELYGSDRSFLSIAKHLSANGSVEVDVILPSEGALSSLFEKNSLFPKFHGKGILRKKDLKKPLSFLFNLIDSIRFYKKLFKQYDVVYINTVVMLSALLASALTKKRRVICHVREIPTGKQMWVFRHLLKLSKANLVFNSFATKRAFNLDGDVVYNGVNINEQSVGSSIYTDDKLVDKGRDFNVLIIGRINDWKGQDLLLKAVSEMPNKEKHKIKIRIVGGTFNGNNEILDSLKLFVVENELSDVVDFFDFSNDPSEHFKWASWVLVPSKKPEPFGRVAAEAFAFGKPVIAAAHGGLTEIITDKRNGLLFSPNSEKSLINKLIQALELSPVEYTSLCQSALREYENRFSELSYQKKLSEIIIGCNSA